MRSVFRSSVTAARPVTAIRARSADDIAQRHHRHDIAAVAVLSGNRNFAGRIHPLVPASYLASPALVVAYAIAGTVLTDLSRSRSATERTASRSCWPTSGRATPRLLRCCRWFRRGAIARPIGTAARACELVGDLRRRRYPIPMGGGQHVHHAVAARYAGGVRRDSDAIEDMRALAILGDGITTDTLSPNGEILAARRRLVSWPSAASSRPTSAIMRRGAAATRSRCAACSPIPTSRTRCWPASAVPIRC